MQALQTNYLKNKPLTIIPNQRRDRGRLEWVASGSGWMFVLLTALVFSHTSCKSSDKEEAGANVSSTSNEENAIAEKKTSTSVPVKPVKISDTPSMSPEALESIVKMTVLVKIPDGPERMGILMEGAAARSGRSPYREYLVICEAPEKLESVHIAYQSMGEIVKSSARKVSTLASGLSIFGFTTKSELSCYSPAETEPKAGDTFKAIRLKGVLISPEEKAAMTSEFETVSSQLSELQNEHKLLKEEHDASREAVIRQPIPEDGSSPRENKSQMLRDLSREYYLARAKGKGVVSEIWKRNSKLKFDLAFPIADIAGVEVAATIGRDGLEDAGAKLENTFLVTKSNAITAIRFQGKWLDLSEVLTSLGSNIGNVKLQVSGTTSRVYLSLSLSPSVPRAVNQYSMVAATTYELESQGSGSIEERLASLKPVPLRGGSNPSISTRLKWNGTKTKLWIKVFNDQNPDELILDEVIEIDYLASFSARWDKPPSPLIAIPESEPNTPDDLVSGSETLDAKGEIRDIIPAGDGSVVMVQTNQSPFWAPLDMKTGKWMVAPWKATAETLLATQAGKIYLIDGKTGMIEIWGLTSGMREGLQILPLDDQIVSVTAPLSNPDKPLMIATSKGCYFIDPVKFELIPSNLDLERYFDIEMAEGKKTTPLDSATLCLRASEDGSLYTFAGVSTNTDRISVIAQTLTVDSSAMVIFRSNGLKTFANRGRYTARGYPDHGGSGVRIIAVTSKSSFPASMGKIKFTDERGNNLNVIIESPPVFLKKAGNYRGTLMPDRRAYFNSTQGVLLLPDGDKLHLLNVNIPEQEKPKPHFIFVGEKFEIPLPAGTEHKLTSSYGGTTEISPDSIRWSAPLSRSSGRQHSLELKWTGELGSPMRKAYQIYPYNPVGIPEVVSADGSKSIPLQRRLILNVAGSDIKSFAGSGSVVLAIERDSISAWNLLTGENLLHKKQPRNYKIFGDADQIYTLGREGKLTSYDILTGKQLQQKNMGRNIGNVTTGMSCRGDLIGVENQGGQSYLVRILRDSLKPVIIELPEQTRRALFNRNLVSNPSGSVVWSSKVGIYRDAQTLTVTRYQNENHGSPDASGKVIFNRRDIIDLSVPNPKKVQFDNFPGMNHPTYARLDISGRYLMLCDPGKDPLWRYVSVRDVREPTKELIQIRYPTASSQEMPFVISTTNSLLLYQKAGSLTKTVVYDFNIPELIKQLSR